ncbi:sirohydrochlorin chelatase [Tessaracoccus antarcticus]|nr:CbiX/SirB N-terminal domain-containing protein [Tessaracoccus antarcticus]
MSTLVIALHGTRRPSGAIFAEGLRDAVSAELPGVDVQLGFVDIHDELLATTVQRLDSSVIVPTFLAAGYHVAHDVAEAVRLSDGRAVATDHVGPDLVDAIHDRLVELGAPGDAVILAAIGSKRPGATAEVHATAAHLSTLIGQPVHPGFIFASQPSLEQAATTLRALGHSRITVATHALLPGRYQHHIAALGLPASHPIGLHPRLVSAIASRYRSTTGDRVMATAARTTRRLDPL